MEPIHIHVLIRGNGMSTLTFEASANRVWFDHENMWVSLTDGRQLSIPLAYFPRLLHATPEQRKKYEMSGGGTGLHWEDIDEDISVEGLLAGRRSGESPSSFKRWMERHKQRALHRSSGSRKRRG